MNYIVQELESQLCNVDDGSNEENNSKDKDRKSNPAPIVVAFKGLLQVR